jgi:acetyl esterase/lipase
VTRRAAGLFELISRMTKMYIPDMHGGSALTRLTIRCLLLVFPVTLIAAPAGVDIDVAYAKDHPAQHLDLYVPAVAKGFATVVFVHGGGLSSGDKRDEDYGKVCSTFVTAGVACASINYRLLQDGAWPAAADDTATAFVWTERNIVLRGGDPKRIFLVGHSSGGRLVATIATDEQFAERAHFAIADIRGVVVMGSIMRDQEFEDAVAKTPPEEVQRLFAAGPEYRGYGTPERYLDSWPMHHIHAGIPPFLFIIAEREKLQPPVLSSVEEFVAAAAKVGCRADYKIVPGRHMDEVRNLGSSADAVLPAILEFIRSSGSR